jgi:hypothetical protein
VTGAVVWPRTMLELVVGNMWARSRGSDGVVELQETARHGRGCLWSLTSRLSLGVGAVNAGGAEVVGVRRDRP